MQTFHSESGAAAPIAPRGGNKVISLELNVADLGRQKSISTDTVVFGQSKVEAFSSRFVELATAQRRAGFAMAVSELGGLVRSRDEYAWIGNMRDVYQQGVEIIMEEEPPFAISIARTGAAGVPLFVSYQSSILVVSWRFEEAVRNLQRARPNREACRIYIENGPALTRETVIAGVDMLWPGESLELLNGRLSFRTCPADGIVVPSIIHTDARVTDSLRDVIAAVMRPCLDVAEAPLIELSGGLDSACVAIAARQCRADLHSYGLVHAGAVGAQQRARRCEIVEVLGLDDFSYPSDEPPQFAALEIEEAQVTPFDDNHRMPCALAVDKHPSGQADLIMSGVGGDELAMEYTFRRQEWELGGFASSSSLTVAAGRADMFMRRGIWTLNPLCAAPVIDFCRALPAKLRKQRMINLLMLARSGLSDGFLFPRYAEGYGHGMQREAALIDFDLALGTSAVADFQVFDFSRLLDQARKASDGGLSYELIVPLFWLMKLEKVLRRYVR